MTDKYLFLSLVKSEFFLPIKRHFLSHALFMSGYFRPGVSKNQLETNIGSSQITVKPPDMPEASILTLYDNIEAEKHRHKQIRSCHSHLAGFF